MVLSITLSTAAAAALINIWLTMRIGRLRRELKISVGDGGNEALGRRMRAQLNFAENTPVVLVLIAAIELSGFGGWWLGPVAAAFLLGRVLHGVGMDGGSWEWGRMIGTIVTLLTQVGLGLAAVLIAARVLG